jgi:hypothetical protein
MCSLQAARGTLSPEELDELTAISDDDIGTKLEEKRGLVGRRRRERVEREGGIGVHTQTFQTHTYTYKHTYTSRQALLLSPPSCLSHHCVHVERVCGMSFPSDKSLSPELALDDDDDEEDVGGDSGGGGEGAGVIKRRPGTDQQREREIERERERSVVYTAYQYTHIHTYTHKHTYTNTHVCLMCMVE